MRSPEPGSLTKRKIVNEYDTEIATTDRRNVKPRGHSSYQAAGGLGDKIFVVDKLKEKACPD